MNLEIIAIILIAISAVFKVLALRNLSDTHQEFAVRQKNYRRMNLPSYLFLVPGFCILIYLYFFAH